MQDRLPAFVRSCLSEGSLQGCNSQVIRWITDLHSFSTATYPKRDPRKDWFAFHVPNTEASASTPRGDVFWHQLLSSGSEYLRIDLLCGHLTWNNRPRGIVRGHLLSCPLRVRLIAEAQCVVLSPAEAVPRFFLTPLALRMFDETPLELFYTVDPYLSPKASLDQLLGVLASRIHLQAEYDTSYQFRSVATDHPSVSLAPAIRLAPNRTSPLFRVGERIISQLEVAEVNGSRSREQKEIFLHDCSTNRETALAHLCKRISPNIANQKRVLFVAANRSKAGHLAREILNRLEIPTREDGTVAWEALARALQEHQKTMTTTSTGEYLDTAATRSLFFRALQKLSSAKLHNLEIKPEDAVDFPANLATFAAGSDRFRRVKDYIQEGPLPDSVPLAPEELAELTNTFVTASPEDQTRLELYRKFDIQISEMYHLPKTIGDLAKAKTLLSDHQDIQFLAFLFQELSPRVRRETLKHFGSCRKLEKKAPAETRSLYKALCSSPANRVADGWERLLMRSRTLLSELAAAVKAEKTHVKLPTGLHTKKVLEQISALEKFRSKSFSWIYPTARRVWRTLKAVKVDGKRVQNWEQIDLLKSRLYLEKAHSRLVGLWKDYADLSTCTHAEARAHAEQLNNILVSLIDKRRKIESIFSSHLEHYTESLSEISNLSLGLISAALVNSLILEEIERLEQELEISKDKIKDLCNGEQDSGPLGQLLSSLEILSAQDVLKSLRLLEEEYAKAHEIFRLQTLVKKASIFKESFFSSLIDSSTGPQVRENLLYLEEALKWKCAEREVLAELTNDEERQQLLGLLSTWRSRDHQPAKKQSDTLSSLLSIVNQLNISPTSAALRGAAADLLPYAVVGLDELYELEQLPIDTFDQVICEVKVEELYEAGILSAFGKNLVILTSNDGIQSSRFEQVVGHFTSYFGLPSSPKNLRRNGMERLTRRASGTVNLKPIEVAALAGTHPLHPSMLAESGFESQPLIFTTSLIAVRVITENSSVILLNAAWHDCSLDELKDLLDKFANSLRENEEIICLNQTGLQAIKQVPVLQSLLRSYGLLDRSNHSAQKIKRLNSFHVSTELDLVETDEFFEGSLKRDSESKRSSGCYLMH